MALQDFWISLVNYIVAAMSASSNILHTILKYIDIYIQMNVKGDLTVIYLFLDGTT